SQYIHGAWWLAATRMASLLKNPEVPGTPAMASEAQKMVQQVHGILLRSPPILRRSCSPETAWMTLPAPRKSNALKNAWVTRWKTPAEKAPQPTPTNM